MLGRAFALRDRGELEEALALCRQAIQVAGPVDQQRFNANSLGAIVVGAQTIDEIASKLGQPVLACEPLANALLVLESANRKRQANGATMNCFAPNAESASAWNSSGRLPDVSPLTQGVRASGREQCQIKLA